MRIPINNLLRALRRLEFAVSPVDIEYRYEGHAKLEPNWQVVVSWLPRHPHRSNAPLFPDRSYCTRPSSQHLLRQRVHGSASIRHFTHDHRLRDSTPCLAPLEGMEPRRNCSVRPTVVRLRSQARTAVDSRASEDPPNRSGLPPGQYRDPTVRLQ